MRAFLALEISEETRKRMGEAVALLRPSTFGVKWVNPAQIHVTLKFFAELDEGLLDSLDAALASAAAAIAPFSYTIQGLGFFGAGGRMRVLWCGVTEGVDELKALQARVDESLRPVGFAPEDRAFSAHLTIGRLREPSREPQLMKALEKQRDFLAGREKAAEVVLFKSDLTPGGPIHTPVKRWALGGVK